LARKPQIAIVGSEPAQGLRVPNKRFFANACLACVDSGRVCHHAPFGKIFEWQKYRMVAQEKGLCRFFIEEIHRRGRKSSTELNLSIRDCYRYPKSRHCIVAPTFAEAKRIYWQDPRMLMDALPGRNGVDYKLNRSDLVVEFPKVGSILQFFGGDDPDSLRGVDARSFKFDEWSQQKLECWTDIVQPIVMQDPSRIVAFTYTPAGQNFATDMFDFAACVNEGYALPTQGIADKLRPGWLAIRLAACSYDREGGLKVESGIFTHEALEAIRRSPETTQQLFEQEFMCARIAEEEFTLITSALIDKLDRKLPKSDGEKAVIACDPAFGGDECSIGCYIGGREVETDEIRTRDPDVIMARLRVMSDTHNVYDFVVDEIGNGLTIVNELEHDKRFNVIRFNSSFKSSNSERWRNLRAEAYWYAAEQVRRQKVEYPKDAETRRQLPFASRYKPDGRAIQIVAKAEIRKLLSNRSPDRADRFIMGQWGLQFARTYLGEFPMNADIWAPYRDRKGHQPDKRYYDPMDYVGAGSGYDPMSILD